MANTGTTTPFDEIDTLHGLLRVALDDARKINRDVYLPTSLEWHARQTYPAQQCRICLAGYVMVEHLQVRPWERRFPGYFDRKTHDRLLAIDALRLGGIETAWDCLQKKGEPFPFPVLSLPYSVIRDQVISVAAFKSWEDWDAAVPVYERLHDALKEAGL